MSERLFENSGQKSCDKQTDRQALQTNIVGKKFFLPSNNQTNKQEKIVMQITILANPPPLQRLPWIHQIVHFIKI